jgi:hypothetical protein
MYPDIGRTLAEQAARQKDTRDATHLAAYLYFNTAINLLTIRPNIYRRFTPNEKLC